jgi:hypothetical protein
VPAHEEERERKGKERKGKERKGMIANARAKRGRRRR